MSQYGLCEVVPVIDGANPSVITGFQQAFEAQRLTTSTWEGFAVFLDQAVAAFDELLTSEHGFPTVQP